jgi:hypothetical protein
MTRLSKSDQALLNAAIRDLAACSQGPRLWSSRFAPQRAQRVRSVSGVSGDLPQPAPTRGVCGASHEKRCNVVGEGVEDGAAAWGRIDGRLSSSGATSARVIP